MIDIGTVLLKFDETYNEESLQVKDYGIRFITLDGRLRTMSARKNVRAPRQQKQASPIRSRGKGMFHLQRHGTMLLHDLQKGEPRTVKVALFTAFKDFRSDTWTNIRH